MELMVPGQEWNLAVKVSNVCKHCFIMTVDILKFFQVTYCGALNVSSSGIGGLTLHFSASPTTIGTRAVYSCSNSRYQIIGSSERRCGVNGRWTGVEPQCKC